MRWFLLALLFPVLAFAEEPTWQHAIAMHGTPKYAADFKQLDYVNPNAPKGGTLRLSFTGTYDNINPYSLRGTLAAGLGWGGPNLTHESLMYRVQDEPFTLYAAIAEKVRVAPDRSWVEFMLNEQARWNDGQPVTPEDVMFSYQQLREKGRPNHRTYYKKVRAARIIPPRTIRFDFITEPAIDREMPLMMGLMPVLSKAWWQGRDISAPTLEPPLTTGPYRIVEVEPGRKLVYERNPNWWANELPYNQGQWNFSRITYDYYRDRNIALEAFKSGAYDLRREQDPRAWLFAYQGVSERQGNITMLAEPHGRPEPMRGFIFNTRRSVFADIWVRQALTVAFDFSWLNRALYNGMYLRSESFFANTELAAQGQPSPEEIAFLAPWQGSLPEGVTTKAYSLPSEGDRRAQLQAAAKLLATAGWQLEKGKLVNAEGQQFAFEILTVDPMDEKLALEFRRTLERLGMLVRIRPVESAQYQSRMTDYDFDMTVNFWASTLSPGNEQLFYWGRAAGQQPGSRNYAGVNSEAIDAIASSLALSLTREELVLRTRALDRALLWGYYVVPLGYLGRDLVAYRNSLDRPAFTPLYGVQPESTWWVRSEQ